MFELLIHAGADVNALSSDGYTALVFAAVGINTNVIEMLIKAGATVDNMNVLLFSRGYPTHRKVYELLRAAGADVKPDEDTRPHLKALCVNTTRSHLLTCHSYLNLFCTVPQLALPALLERLLLLNVSLSGSYGKWHT